MIKGMSTDVGHERLRFQRFRGAAADAGGDDLLTYCYRVAGTVGEMLLPVMGLDQQVTEEAIALGCAVQLLNILRDTREDLELRGRLYLPLEDAARVGLSEAELEEVIRSGVPDARYRRLLRLQGLRVALLLSRAESSLPRISNPLSASLVAVLIELHRELLRTLRARDYDNLSISRAERGYDRLRIPTSSKLRISIATIVRVLLASSPGERLVAR